MVNTTRLLHFQYSHDLTYSPVHSFKNQLVSCVNVSCYEIKFHESIVVAGFSPQKSQPMLLLQWEKPIFLSTRYQNFALLQGTSSILLIYVILGIEFVSVGFVNSLFWPQKATPSERS